MTSTFQYAGYYAHQCSGLNFTWYRGYDPGISTWLSRDPLPNAERLQGPNLYQYVGNGPLESIDPQGLIDLKVVLISLLSLFHNDPDGPSGPNSNFTDPGDPIPPKQSCPAPKPNSDPTPSPTPRKPQKNPWKPYSIPWWAVPIIFSPVVVGVPA